MVARNFFKLYAEVPADLFSPQYCIGCSRRATFRAGRALIACCSWDVPCAGGAERPGPLKVLGCDEGRHKDSFYGRELSYGTKGRGRSSCTPQVQGIYALRKRQWRRS